MNRNYNDLLEIINSLIHTNIDISNIDISNIDISNIDISNNTINRDNNNTNLFEEIIRDNSDNNRWLRTFFTNNIEDSNEIDSNEIESNEIESNEIESNEIDNSVQNIINESFYENNPYKKVLSEKGMDQLKTIYFNKSCNCNQCPITQKEFIENEKITELPCGHLFNSEAIEKWLCEEKAICPVCRLDLDSIEIKNESNNLILDNNFPPLYENNNHELFRQLYNVNFFAIIERQEEENLQRVILNSFEN